MSDLANDTKVLTDLEEKLLGPAVKELGDIKAARLVPHDKVKTTGVSLRGVKEPHSRIYIVDPKKLSEFNKILKEIGLNSTGVFAERFQDQTQYFIAIRLSDAIQAVKKIGIDSMKDTIDKRLQKVIEAHGPDLGKAVAAKTPTTAPISLRPSVAAGGSGGLAPKQETPKEPAAPQPSTSPKK